MIVNMNIIIKYWYVISHFRVSYYLIIKKKKQKKKHKQW